MRWKKPSKPESKRGKPSVVVVFKGGPFGGQMMKMRGPDITLRFRLRGIVGRYVNGRWTES